MAQVGIFRNNLMIGNTFISNDLKHVEHNQATYICYDKLEVCTYIKNKEEILSLTFSLNEILIGGISISTKNLEGEGLSFIKSWFSARGIEVGELGDISKMQEIIKQKSLTQNK